MTDATDGWGAVGPVIYRTTDGGQTWSNVTPPATAGEASRPNATVPWFASDAKHAWVLDGLYTAKALTLLRTADGGQTWQSATVPVPGAGAGVESAALSFPSAQAGFLVSMAGPGGVWHDLSALRTNDGGTAWSLVNQTCPAWNLGNPQACAGAASLPADCGNVETMWGMPTSGWIVANCPGDVSIFVTSDGGTSWRRAVLPGVDPTATGAVSPQVFVRDAGVVLVQVSNRDGSTTATAYRTSDGGRTWQAGQGITRHTLGFVASFPDPQHGFVADGKDMFVTSNGGATWHSYVPNVNLDGTRQLNFISASVGFALMERPTGSQLVRTLDGGHAWSEVA